MVHILLKKHWLRGLLSHFAHKVTHAKISGVYVIKKRWLRTNLGQPTQLKINGEYVIKKRGLRGGLSRFAYKVTHTKTSVHTSFKNVG